MIELSCPGLRIDGMRFETTSKCGRLRVPCTSNVPFAQKAGDDFGVSHFLEFLRTERRTHDGLEVWEIVKEQQSG